MEPEGQGVDDKGDDNEMRKKFRRMEIEGEGNERSREGEM